MSWLFPDERMFFRHFSEIAARLTTLATLLENALDDPTLVRAVRDIEAAVSHIRTGDEVLARCQAIKQAEEEGDAVWAAAVTDLFAGTPTQWMSSGGRACTTSSKIRWTPATM